MNTTNFFLFAAEKLSNEGRTAFLKGAGNSNIFAMVGDIQRELREDQKRSRKAEQGLDVANAMDEQRRFENIYEDVERVEADLQKRAAFDAVARASVDQIAENPLYDYVMGLDAVLQLMQEGDSKYSPDWLKAAKETGAFTEDELKAGETQRAADAKAWWEIAEPVIRNRFASLTISEKDAAALDEEAVVDDMSVVQQHDLIVAGGNAIAKAFARNKTSSMKYNSVKALGTLGMLQADLNAVKAFYKEFQKRNLQALRAHIESGRNLKSAIFSLGRADTWATTDTWAARQADCVYYIDAAPQHRAHTLRRPACCKT